MSASALGGWAYAGRCAAGVLVCATAAAGWHYGPHRGMPGLGLHAVNARSLVTWDPDGAGPLGDHLIVNGRFEIAGDTLARDLAIWDGEHWQPFGANNPNLTALVNHDGQLIGARGGSGPAGSVQIWNGAAWVALGTPPFPVGQLLSADGALYGAPLADASPGDTCVWDGVSWSTVGTPAGGGIRALARFDGKLVIAGRFRPGGPFSPWATVAAWNGAGWEVWLEEDSRQNTLLVDNGSLYVAGGSQNANVVRLRVANGWQQLGDSFNAPITRLGSLDGTLIAIGDFRTIGVESCSGAARWDGQSWVCLGSGTDWGYASSPGGGSCLAVYGDSLVVGGQLRRAGAVEAYGIARWHSSTWHALSRGFSFRILEFGHYGGELIAGGEFRNAGGVTANYIARWNGLDWNALGAGVNDDVYAMAEHAGSLVVGGIFTEAGGNSVSGVARWDGAAWHALGAGMGGGGVSALVEFNGLLIAGGTFTTADGMPAPYLAQWTGTQWLPLGQPINARVNALLVHDGALYVGGNFTSIGGIAANCIARWDGVTWQALGAGMNAQVNVLSAHLGDLVAGGNYTTAGGITANRIARWDGAGWHAFGPGVDDYVAAIVSDAGWLYVGGGQYIGGLFNGCLSRWDGSHWLPMNMGVDDFDSSEHVSALAAFGGEIIVGGYFGTAGGQLSAHWARWTPSAPGTCPGDADCDGDVDFFDIDPFVSRIGCPSGGDACDSACSWLAADADLDGDVDFFDIDAFVARIGATCP